MKSSLEQVSTLERKLNIEVPAEEVQAAFDRAFQSLQKQVEIKGFRKGKAPLSAVKPMFVDRVKQDVAENLIHFYYPRAVQEHSLHPITYPTFEFDPIEEKGKFAFSAEFEIRPELKNIKADALLVKKEKLVLDAARVDELLQNLQQSRAETAPVLEDRSLAEGDIATLDFEGSLLTGPLQNGSAENHDLEIGSKSFIPGFEEGLIGMRIGQERTVPLAFPDDYHAEDVRGKPVNFKVKLKSIKKKVLPELNDELAKALGKDSIAELRQEMEKNIEERERKRIEDDLRARIMRVLVENNPIEVPKKLVQEQRQLLVEQVKRRSRQQGLPEEAFHEYEQKWQEDFNKTATFMIRSGLLVDAIAAQEKLFADEKDFDNEISGYAKEMGLPEKQVRSFYQEDEEKKRQLLFNITERKVTDFLLNKARVTEVTREQLEGERTASPDLTF